MEGRNRPSALGDFPTIEAGCAHRHSLTSHSSELRHREVAPLSADWFMAPQSMAICHPLPYNPAELKDQLHRREPAIERAFCCLRDGG